MRNQKKVETYEAKEVAEKLGISMPTLHRRVKAGELVPVPKTLGQKRHYRLKFPKEDIDKILQGEV